MVRGQEVSALKTKNMMPLANLCEVLTTWLPKLKITERKIYAAFWLSKMTCADENEDGPVQYWHLKFVEFLEFICRLAYLYY